MHGVPRGTGQQKKTRDVPNGAPGRMVFIKPFQSFPMIQ